jgi:SAM-dependent methyltransferase
MAQDFGFVGAARARRNTLCISSTRAGATEPKDKPATHQLRCGEVLDPALALAAQLAGVGRVTACDRVDAFVRALADEARARRLDNIEAVTGDMAALPLSAACCTQVVSRLGLQFAPEPDDVLHEVLRILRPEGRALFLVWGAPEQPLLRATVNDVLEACGAPPFELGGFGPVRLSEPGELATRMKRAGFHAVQETSERTTWGWPGNAESFWSATRQTSAPLFDPLFARLDRGARDELERHTLAKLRAFSRGDTLEIPVEVRWAEGTR